MNMDCDNYFQAPIVEISQKDEVKNDKAEKVSSETEISQNDEDKNDKAEKVSSKVTDSITERFSCTKCEKTFAHKTNRARHLRRIHKVVREKGTYACNLCDKVYKSSSTLSLHRRRTHHEAKKVIITVNYDNKCQHCKKCFASTMSLQRHLQRFHENIPPPNAAVSSLQKCIHPNCSSTFYHRTQMIAHFNQHHPDQPPIEKIKKDFNNLSDFFEWKREEEEDNHLCFVAHRGWHKTANNSRQTFICQRDGLDRVHGGVRKGTNHIKKEHVKANKPCPARIVCIQNSDTGEVNASYYRTHSHAITIEETRFRRIPRNVTERIRKQLGLGYSCRKIQRLLRGPVSQSYCKKPTTKRKRVKKHQVISLDDMQAGVEVSMEVNEADGMEVDLNERFDGALNRIRELMGDERVRERGLPFAVGQLENLMTSLHTLKEEEAIDH